ncbi:tetratricopeptide repeat protein partial [Lichtheimia corymbifera JMRC:FSU:9682]|uniref:Tetratricopeptide repeat protein partial n=1 Tax=Lichtheimia corymbifera JMRC:FSU:9682 TaxID=1263082 RepID=A0A068RI73_9FUNG|nr:tetratricopeptide repeat protein partial [Lichtheimia corymbifera JMRC:FSU:9682]
MAKGKSDTAKNANTPRKTAWKGIAIKPKSPSRPGSTASAHSQESRKSVNTIASSTLSNEGAVSSSSSSSLTDTTAQVESTPPPTNNNVQEPSKGQQHPIEDTNKTMNGDTKKKEDLQPPPSEEDEDDQASTPRAGSRKSSIAGLDSASEVFEDAYDDDDYFDDVPTFEEPQQSNHGAKSPMNVILPALQGLENEDDRDNEIESLGIAENHYHAISTPPVTTTTQQQPVSLSTTTTTTNIDHESTLDHTATTDDSSKPIKDETTQPVKQVTKETTLPNNEVAKETAQPVKESNNKEAVHHVKEITKETITPQADKEDDQKEEKEEESWKPDPNAMSMDGFMQEVQEAELAFRDDEKEQRSTDAPFMSAATTPYYNNDTIEKEHHVEKSTVDVLQDLEDLDTKRDDRPESIELAPAPRGDTDSPVTDNGLFDTKTSDEVSQPTRNTSIADDDHHHHHDSSNNNNNKKEKEEDHLGAILPVMEDLAREIIGEQPTDMDRAAARSLEYEHPVEDPIDLDMFRDNVISIPTIDPKCVPINTLTPRDQEEADEPVREGMQYLFDNKFMKAKAIFQSKASIDPLYALGLGSMAFIKAMMTYQEDDIETAMTALATSYTIAKAQIDNMCFRKPLKEAVTQYFSTFLASNNKSGLPSSPAPVIRTNSPGQPREAPIFLPNGILRAHVIKAESCLLMAIIQLSQESVMNYLKCGLNLRRAYSSYSVVWQEYKRMGQEYTKHMDRDTVSAIQFGIGAVHLLLSSMPAKVLKVFSTLGWQSDKQLGFALLKLCLEGRGIRAPLASLTLLSYYTILTSFTPQLYAKEMMGPAIECLLDAQKHHPSSCFFLFYAARIARVARNLPLSTQSFAFAVESSRGEWAETAMRQMADYETGFNLALQLDWEGAAVYFDKLSHEKYWSPAFSRYFAGACYEMLGQRTECILAFAQVPELAKEQQHRKTYIDAHVHRRVEFFQKSGYQDMDFSLPGLEILLVWNAFVQMEPDALEKCLDLVQHTLELVYEREKMEYNIRLKELVPTSTPPDYYDQRAILLLTKASILNALERYTEGIPHLNWVMDHKDYIKHETWVVPFAYWEAGVTSWGLGNVKKSRKLWQLALSCNKYDFEYRMAVRLSLALSRCDEVGVSHIDTKQTQGMTTHGRKRMPILDP